MTNSEYLFCRVPADSAEPPSGFPVHHVLYARHIADLWEGVQRRKAAVESVCASTESLRHPFRMPDPGSYYDSDGSGTSVGRDPRFREILHGDVPVDGTASGYPAAGLVKECLDWIVGSVMNGTWADPDMQVNHYSGPVGKTSTSKETSSSSSDFPEDEGRPGFSFVPDGGDDSAGLVKHDPVASTAAGRESAMSDSSGYGEDAASSGTAPDGTEWRHDDPGLPGTSFIPNLMEAFHVLGGGSLPEVSVTATKVEGRTTGSPSVSDVSVAVEVPKWYGFVRYPEDRLEEYLKNAPDGAYVVGHDVTVPSGCPVSFTVSGESGGVPACDQLTTVPGGAVVDVTGSQVYTSPAYSSNFFSSRGLDVGGFGRRFADLDRLVVPPWPPGYAPSISADDIRDGRSKWRGTMSDPTGGAAVGVVVTSLLGYLECMTRTVHPVGVLRVSGKATSSSTYESAGTSTKEYRSSESSSWTAGDCTGSSSVSSTSTVRSTTSYRTVSGDVLTFDMLDSASSDVLSFGPARDGGYGGISGRMCSPRNGLAVEDALPYRETSNSTELMHGESSTGGGEGSPSGGKDSSTSTFDSVEQYRYSFLSSSELDWSVEMSLVEPVMTAAVRESAGGGAEDDPGYPFGEADYHCFRRTSRHVQTARSEWSSSRTNAGRVSVSSTSSCSDGSSSFMNTGTDPESSKGSYPAGDDPAETVTDYYDDDDMDAYLEFIPASVRSMVKSASMYAVFGVAAGCSVAASVGEITSRRTDDLTSGEEDGGADEDSPEPFTKKWFERYAGDPDEKTSSDRTDLERWYSSGGLKTARIASYSGGKWTSLFDPKSLLPDPFGDDSGETKSSESMYRMNMDDESAQSESYSSSVARVSGNRSRSVDYVQCYVVVDWDFSKAEREDVPSDESSEG